MLAIHDWFVKKSSSNNYFFVDLMTIETLYGFIPHGTMVYDPGLVNPIYHHRNLLKTIHDDRWYNQQVIIGLYHHILVLYYWVSFKTPLLINQPMGKRLLCPAARPRGCRSQRWRSWSRRPGHHVSTTTKNWKIMGKNWENHGKIMKTINNWKIMGNRLFSLLLV